MATPGQPTPQQHAAMQHHLTTEAAKRGMTPEEFSNMQRQQLAAEAAKQGLTPEQYIAQLKAKALQQHQQQQQAKRAHEHGENHPQHVPMNSNAPPNPRAVAVADFLRSQNLKPRTCILDGRRRELFKVKRAIRAIQSPAYAKAQLKAKSLLPPVTDKASAENAFKLLPLSLLALRVSKVDPHAGHNHAKPKNRVKGLWTVKVEQNQEIDPMMHYVWLYEGPQWKQKAMAAGVLVVIMAVVMFPLWPIMLRQGVWYLSIGAMGLLGLFFAMSIFRLILFCVTYFAVPPGLWLYPNLFEDVGFFDSFRPVWGWQESKKSKKKSKKTNTGTGTAASSASKSANSVKAPPSNTGGSSTGVAAGEAIKRDLAPRVEEADDE
ncbi:translocation protein sec62 [Histoplasma capsulatum]|uniref:Translocation protein SEC62 n=1 Tax=Ajellomyces capsulatus TaxID=5037 RepID=A0A8A1M990_AJECA|nr:conserved hypothetical protein [Histoplasma mississippiense (nom. inval.)]EDN07256.1 conserved hypothetical protein [Histoplasma mississippiense (nom. inval.)]QSS61303.1 translocation protein sec62 [Histoplasma capsulatum]